MGHALAVALAVIGSLLMSGTIARRLERTNRTAREVMAGHLEQRVPSHGVGDEFDRLADNLNGMLDQIQYLIESIRQVSDNGARGLRTPLIRLRWRLGRHQAGDDPDRTLLEQSIAGCWPAKHLPRPFAHRRRRVRQPPAFHARRCDRIGRRCRGALRTCRRRARAHPGVRAGAPVYLDADRDLLCQALTDTAVKYTPAGGTLYTASNGPVNPLVG